MKKSLINKIAFLLLFFGVVLLVVGVLVIVNSSKDEVKEADKIVEKDKIKELEELEEIVEDIDENESVALKQQHCANSICINELFVRTYNHLNMSVVSADLINTSAQNISKGYIKIVFLLGDKNFEKMLFYDEIPANGSVSLEWQHDNEELLNAVDYQLVEPTEAELIAEKQKQEKLNDEEK